MKKPLLLFFVFLLIFISIIQIAEKSSEHAVPTQQTTNELTAVSELITYTEKTEYYEISGDDESELREEMRQKSKPCYGSSTLFDACTSWYLSWHVPLDDSGQSCELPTSVKVDVTFSYPEWVDSDSADYALQRKWNTYITNLQKHEYQHKEHVLTGANDLAATIETISEEYSCSVVHGLADTKGNEILARIRAKDVQYDKETNHGETQGALFP